MITILVSNALKNNKAREGLMYLNTILVSTAKNRGVYHERQKAKCKRVAAQKRDADHVEGLGFRV